MNDDDISIPGDQPTGALRPRGEHRWPVLGMLAVASVLPLFIPERLTLGPKWLLPSIEGALLVAVAVTDPGRIDQRSRQVRSLRLTLIFVLAAGTAFATVHLINELIRGGGITNSAGLLLEAGSLVWLELVIVFAFLYWELDAGGPGQRVHEPTVFPDLAFPQHLNPDVARPGWRPVFYDYLYLGFTNSTAFSPTDVMPMAHWAKLTMAVQSLASLLILGLIVARAVNILN
jgi:uncharacterized membrane protein